MRDMGLGDTPLALGWCSESLCVGFRSQYVLLNPSTGVANEVFPCGRQGAVNILPLPNAELLLTKVRLSPSVSSVVRCPLGDCCARRAHAEAASVEPHPQLCPPSCASSAGEP